MSGKFTDRCVVLCRTAAGVLGCDPCLQLHTIITWGCPCQAWLQLPTRLMLNARVGCRAWAPQPLALQKTLLAKDAVGHVLLLRAVLVKRGAACLARPLCSLPLHVVFSFGLRRLFWEGKGGGIFSAAL